jgi:hypothetical protein
MFKLDDPLNIDINQSLKSLPDDLLVLGLDKYFAGVLFLHGHGRGDLDLELFVFGFFVVFGLFED